MWTIFSKGGPVMYPLAACSVIALSVIIDRTIFWIKHSLQRKPSLVAEILEFYRRGELEAIRKKTAGCRDFVVKVLVSGIVHREFSMVKAMEAAATEEIKRMRRFMPVLDTMITVAPLLGIFGTVIGIISSFEILGTAGIEHPQAVTAGIAQALITTAAGLGIAILSVFPYNYFNSRVENAVLTIEQYATGLEVVSQKQVAQTAMAGSLQDENSAAG
ncbi:MAG: flagellar motor protein MotA [Desulfobacteraceae bacterium 4572_123]|nr:MAG: flagellar motor protein MotA [Desulfobacteraceae bacterium 4572_123]